jgi:hypothetical protein
LTALVGNVTNSREELASTDVCLEDRCFVRARTLEDIWQYDIRAHLDVVTLDLGAADTEGALRGLLQQRGVSVVVCRLSGDSVTEAGMRALAEAAAAHDYFALLTAPCDGKAGPSVTYEPMPGNFDLEGDQLMIVLDLRIPDLFQLIPLGDDECGVEDDADPGGPPGPVEWIRVVDEAPRSLVIRFARAVGATQYRVIANQRELVLEASASEYEEYFLNALQPGEWIDIQVRGISAGGEGPVGILRHRVPLDKTQSRFRVREGVHCGMSPSHEVQPTGPPPQGRSFHRDVKTVAGCEQKCSEEPACITFQVKEGDACWLYRQAVAPDRLEGGAGDEGWACGMKTAD